MSRQAATKGRAVLEGVELDSETIKACFNNASEEDAVQDGLIKWKDGQGIQPPTWCVLLDAMEYARIAQQHTEDLKKELLVCCLHWGAVCDVCACAHTHTSECACVCKCVRCGSVLLKAQTINFKS